MNQSLKTRRENETLSIFVYDTVKVSDDYGKKDVLVPDKAGFVVSEVLEIINVFLVNKNYLANPPTVNNLTHPTKPLHQMV